MTNNKQYPELPVIEHWLNETYTASQMREYVEADRAMRAAQAETAVSLRDNLRPDLIADLREVFDTSGPETPQAVRDVVEYTDSWLRAYIQKRLGISVQPQEAALTQAKEGST